jgi:hypothetical protein
VPKEYLNDENLASIIWVFFWEKRFRNDPMEEPRANHYKNVMEVLVDEEIDRQTRSLPLQVAHRFNRIEIATFALNRLPPLYASSQEGVEFQYDYGQKNLSDQIAGIVEDALSVIKNEPIRVSTPFGA